MLSFPVYILASLSSGDIVRHQGSLLGVQGLKTALRGILRPTPEPVPAPAPAAATSFRTPAPAPTSTSFTILPDPTSSTTGADADANVDVNLDIAAKVEAVLSALQPQFDKSVLLYQTPTNTWAPSSVYKFPDMMVALKQMYTTGIGDKKLWLSEANYKYGLVNIAAFLAQSMHETIKYDACDENSWDMVEGRYPASNSCGQLGQSYGDYSCPLGEEHMQCEVDPDMEITATTNAKWYGAPGGMFCGPKSHLPDPGYWDYSAECNKPWADPPQLCTAYDGQQAGRWVAGNSANSDGRTDVEGCCWWGRGVIQSTGVCNYGKLNYYIGKRAHEEGRGAAYPDIDFCRTPDAICASTDHPELKWIAGLFYWSESVQTYGNNNEGWNYFDELKKFVDGGFNNPGTDTGFIHATSGIVNRGCYDPPCGTGALDGGAERAKNFETVLKAMGLV